MEQVIQDFYDRLDVLRVQLNQGDIYKNLPTLMVAARRRVGRKKRRTAVKLPETNPMMLGRMLALNKRYRDRLAQASQDNDDSAAPLPQDLKDEDLDFILDQLGSTDLRMRDHGAFYLFNDLLRSHTLTDEQFHYSVAVVSSPEYLFAHILEPESDAMFRRSFAMLVLGTLLFADRNDYHTLTGGEILVILHRVATYALLEQDGRGYVDGKGWGHTWMHVGNVVDELIERNITRADKIFLLSAVILGYRDVADGLVFGEDQRLAFSLSSIANKETFYSDYLLLLLKQWQEDLQHIHPQENITFWNRWYNRNRLLTAMILRGDFPDSILRFLNNIANNNS
ncbi:DUF2785 domain-containing protein [Schleiferilactobacillus shenzhenensis]|uniref:DUF2785 domain-containing protein n=1 Tax=Schleiferilactobacillus shenzhenensis LY-73 TaxID=1231336 RepID=U4TSN8_9LACO|nr:DUF2785 domain-containing protein [Schleiferilactobacillus shenzhenensis]ERL66440.1 hypothetical protein L248_0119 [Schleiferilactobacillus shenzhenensis LY-73]